MAAAAVQTPSAFAPDRFIADYKKTAELLGAPYSEKVVAGTVNDFPGCFDETVIWRATSRPNDKLNYRFYLSKRTDTVALAAEAGYVDADAPMSRLATAWSGLNGGDSVQWVDLDPADGVAKTWCFLKAPRPIGDILGVDEIPESTRAHLPTFIKLGLSYAHFVAVDHQGGTFNIYWTVPGPITEAQAAAYTALAGAEPPTAEEFTDLRQYLPEQRFVFAATINYDTGNIKRVAFYALNIPAGPLPPTTNERLRTFFEQAPTYDTVQTRNIAWSYGNGNSKYMKGEASYTGELSNWVKNVRGPVGEKMAKLLEDARANMVF
ncbi:prenyltransferase-like protein [Hypoxylon sp. FL0890]|nr:prenyltransferase-like protein [Hypoxylon sp. FL0890]